MKYLCIFMPKKLQIVKITCLSNNLYKIHKSLNMPSLYLENGLLKTDHIILI